MATFRPCIQKQRSDGFYPVYIRVIHERQSAFMKTDKVVDKKSISKNREIRDNIVLRYCADLICQYNERLNTQNISSWSIKEVVAFLSTDEQDCSFSDYARKHIGRMINRGQDGTAKNYKLAVAHLERYIGTNQIMFSYITSTVLRKWIGSMETKKRAKEMYPICVRQIFKAAMLELNDEERGIIKIKFNPWPKVQIPKSDQGEKIAISAEACREFFTRPLPETKMRSSLPELGRDVAKLVLCLGGINTADLFELKKENYKNGVIGYKRAKTRHSRTDEAYFEMRVEPFIQPIFDKYLADEDDEYLFNFHKRYCDSSSFGSNVNNGIQKICKDMGLEKDDYYCVYTFRHTWGTIAQNDCDANLFEVAFGMNHSHGLKVTRGYVKIDYSPAWNLNAKVIDFIFFTNKRSKQGVAKDVEEPQDKLFRISKKTMVYARVYFKGEELGSITDIGFSTVDAVINALIPKLPSDIPIGCGVQFRIKNCDNGREIVHERIKGKGF